MDMFIEKLDEMVKNMQAEEARLCQSACKDEANLAKIKANIIGICKTVWQVVGRTEEMENRKSAYLRKLENLAASWQESKARAEKYDDADQAMIESIKLDVLSQAVRMFEEMNL